MIKSKEEGKGYLGALKKLGYYAIDHKLLLLTDFKMIGPTLILKRR